MIETETRIDDRYEVIDLVARGGMADVYRAMDTRLDREVAVKVVREANDELVRRLVLESNILARLNHPAIVGIHDAGEHEGLPYLVMQLVEGTTLADRLRDDGPLRPEQLVGIARPLAEGLAHAHELDVTHRDVKPGNVLCELDGSPRLSDFGIAHAVGNARMTQTGLVVGTGAYLAPEQLAGREVGPPADVYSLGLVLLECLTGERAFPGTDAEATAARLARDPAIPDHIPAAWASLLRDMTQRDTSGRPTATEVAERAGQGDDRADWAFNETDTIPVDGGTQVLPVQDLPADAPPAGTPPSQPVARRGWSPWHTRVLLAVLVAIAVVVGIAVGVMTTRSGDDGAPAGDEAEPTSTIDIPSEVQEAYDHLREVIRQ